MEKQLIDDLKKMLPRGSFKIIEKMLKKRYSHRTIEAMFRTKRTMSPVVFECGKKLVQTINPPTNEPTI